MIERFFDKEKKVPEANEVNIVNTPEPAIKEEPKEQQKSARKDIFTDSFKANAPSSPAKQESKQPPMPEPEHHDNDIVTPLTELKGPVEELFNQAEKHMKDSFYEKAIEIYRVILKKEPRNTLVRQKLHQAYLLLAQQEEEIVKSSEEKRRPAPQAGEPKREKKSKISYL